MRDKKELNAQERAMREIQELAFALQETNLYLDGHPQNTRAMRYYTNTLSEYRAAVAKYEEEYGPVTAMGTKGTTAGWAWVRTPWPWELKFPSVSDYDGSVDETSEHESADMAGEE